MKKMHWALGMVIVFCAGSAFADQIGDCTTTMKDGKSYKAKIYTKGDKSLVETVVDGNKSRVIKDGPNMLVVMDAQKMCMKLNTPQQPTPPPGNSQPVTNSDGSTTKCNWTSGTNPDSMYKCPADYKNMNM